MCFTSNKDLPLLIRRWGKKGTPIISLAIHLWKKTAAICCLGSWTWRFPEEGGGGVSSFWGGHGKPASRRSSSRKRLGSHPEKGVPKAPSFGWTPKDAKRPPLEATRLLLSRLTTQRLEPALSVEGAL